MDETGGRRVRFGEVEVVFVLAFLAVVPLWRRGLLDDPALGRHLRGPDAIRVQPARRFSRSPMRAAAVPGDHAAPAVA